MSPTSLSSPAVKQRHTAEEYSRTPEGPPWMQLIDGEYYVADSPLDPHQAVVVNLGHLLVSWARSTASGLIRCAPLDVYLSDYDVVQPDLLYLSKEKYVLRRNGRIFGPPDLVVEILSPSTAALDLGPKRALYARSLVPEMWAVDPDLRQVSVFRFSQDPDRPIAVLPGEQKLSSPLLPRFSARILDLFEP